MIFMDFIFPPQCPGEEGENFSALGQDHRMPIGPIIRTLPPRPKWREAHAPERGKRSAAERIELGIASEEKRGGSGVFGDYQKMAGFKIYAGN
jgi:hypothetical protein